jgi:uncharacterized protein YcgL (UPF0745 family)
MICKIFRSDSKPGTYLYLHEQTSLDDVPAELMKLIGRYTEVMELDLNEREKLAQVDIQKVKDDLKEKGFFLQIQRESDRQLISYG